MHLSTISLLSLLPAALAASVSFIIPPSQILPNPSSLPPTTSIQLSTTSKTLTVPISPHNTFTAHNLTQGSYLVETAALPYVFYPVRLDVFRDGSAQASIAFRDNAWGNKGEVLRRGGGGEWELRVTRRGEWYVKREGFSPRKLLMNPMILIAFVSLFALVVIPKIIDNSTSSLFITPPFPHLLLISVRRC